MQRALHLILFVSRQTSDILVGHVDLLKSSVFTNIYECGCIMAVGSQQRAVVVLAASTHEYVFIKILGFHCRPHSILHLAGVFPNRHLRAVYMWPDTPKQISIWKMYKCGCSPISPYGTVRYTLMCHIHWLRHCAQSEVKVMQNKDIQHSNDMFSS